MSTKRKRQFFNYSQESLDNALRDIKAEGLSVLGASVKYNVPRSTIQDRIHGRVQEARRKMGPPTVLTSSEEDRLVKWCDDLAKCGFPLKIDNLKNTVQSIMKEDKRKIKLGSSSKIHIFE